VHVLFMVKKHTCSLKGGKRRTWDDLNR